VTAAPTPLALEHAALSVWPARAHEACFGWRLLAEDGYTGRANAVWPLQWTGEITLLETVAAAEAWYAARGLPAVFKLSDGATAPSDLAMVLAGRGYSPQTETLVMTRLARPAPQEISGRPSVALSENPEMAFDAVMAATARSPEELAERRAIAARVPRPRAYGALVLEGRPAAAGLTALAAGGYGGIFAMRTEPGFRRRGLGRAVLDALMRFAAEHGAHWLFLQVEAANEPAVSLYRRAGFVTAYGYRFWRKP
jgi:ribosomal protein S18 acetylase RimI-like enzyme